MFSRIMKVVFPVVVVLSLSMGAFAWSASSVAFAAGQNGQGLTGATPTPTATPAAYNAPSPYYPQAPFYGYNGGNSPYSPKNGWKFRTEEGAEKTLGCLDKDNRHSNFFKNNKFCAGIP